MNYGSQARLNLPCTVNEWSYRKLAIPAANAMIGSRATVYLALRARQCEETSLYGFVNMLEWRMAEMQATQDVIVIARNCFFLLIYFK